MHIMIAQLRLNRQERLSYRLPVDKENNSAGTRELQPHYHFLVQPRLARTFWPEL